MSQFGENKLTTVQHKSKRGINRTVQSLTTANVENNDSWVHLFQQPSSVQN